MHRTLAALLAAVATCLLLGAPTRDLQAEEIDLDTPLPSDPAIVRRVTLDNGFTYWIRPHKIPGTVVELGLHVRAGSLDENEDERGLAHFLEHMAFNGSTHFPPGEVVRFFESQGLKFGQHQNANTSYDRTKYFLSLPTNDPAILEKGLTFFADVAYGLTLSPKELDAERPIILEEERARAGAGERLQKLQLKALAPDARVTKRGPIGLASVIRTASAATMRGFYERCYRPERTTLLVCGDVTPEVIEPVIRKLFASWKGKGESVRQPASGLKQLAELRTSLDTDPDHEGATVLLMRPIRKGSEQTVGDLRRVIVRILGMIAATMRWQRLAGQGGPFEGLGVDDESIAGRDSIALAAIAGEGASWRVLTEILVRELRRIHEHGFTDDELAVAKRIAMAQLGRVVQLSRTWNAKKQLEEMFDAVGSGSTAYPGEPAMAWVEKFLPTIQKSEVESSFKDTWTLENGLLAARLPADLADGPTQDAFAAHVRKTLAKTVVSRNEVDSKAADLGPTPEPGKVRDSTFDAPWQAHTWHFENGAIVRYRPMATPNYAMVKVALIGGTLEDGAGQRGRTHAAALAFGAGTMASKTNSATRLRGHVLGLKVGLVQAFGEDRVEIAIEGPPGDIEGGLRLLHHVLSAPKVEGPALARWKQTTKREIERAAREVSVVAAVRARALAVKDEPRVPLLTAAQVDGVTPEAAQARAEAIARSSPLTVAIVGSLEKDEVLRLASLWLGSLPARPAAGEAFQAKRRTTFAMLPRSETVKVDTSTDRAAVRLQWRGVDRAKRSERASLMQAANVLMSQMQAELREKRGLTYTAAAQYEESELAGLDSIVVTFTADPVKAKAAADLARSIVERLRDKGPTDAEVEATTRQMHHQLQRAAGAPAFWAHVLTHLESHELTPVTARAGFLAWTRVDAARMRAVLAKVIRPDRAVEVVAVPTR